MAQVNADIRFVRIVENVPIGASLANEHEHAAVAVREVIAFADSRGFKATFAHVHSTHHETLVDRPPLTNAMTPTEPAQN